MVQGTLEARSIHAPWAHAVPSIDQQVGTKRSLSPALPRRPLPPGTMISAHSAPIRSLGLRAALLFLLVTCPLAQGNLRLRDPARGVESSAAGLFEGTVGRSFDVQIEGKAGALVILELRTQEPVQGNLRGHAGFPGSPPMHVMAGGRLDSTGHLQRAGRLPESLPLGRDFWIQALLYNPADGSHSRTNTVRIHTQPWKLQDLPLLPSGQWMGLSYTTPAPERSSQVDSLWNASHAAGLGVLPLSLAWSDLEPTPGFFDSAQLELLLMLAEVSGLRPYLVLTTIDSVRLTLPADLVDPQDDRKLAGARRWNDPLLSRRLSALLEHLLPILTSYGGFYLSIGQDVDGLLFDSASDTKDYAALLRSVRGATQHLRPKFALGTTISWAGLQSHPELFDTLLQASDNVALTYAPLNADHSVQDPKLVKSHMQRMLQAVAPRPLLLQEYAYPSGYAPAASNGSSEEKQRQFIEQCFKAFREHPRIRMANYMGVCDLGPADLGLLQLHYNSSQLNFVEYLSSVGLAHYASAQPKSAHREFMKGLKGLRQR